MFAVLSKLGQVDTFTQTLAAFLRHFKSSGTTIADFRKRGNIQIGAHRGTMFLKIFEPLLKAYQKRLSDRIDFEDMIIRAAEHVEAGRYKSHYRHLLVDEFQNISKGRARLLKALKMQHPDARLFAVGDDWQSIYRFAGSDISLMREFGEGLADSSLKRKIFTALLISGAPFGTWIKSRCPPADLFYRTLCKSTKESLRQPTQIGAPSWSPTISEVNMMRPSSRHWFGLRHRPRTRKVYYCWVDTAS